MRFITFTLLIFVSCFANNILNVSSFTSNFVQSVVNESNKKIVYNGVVYVKRNPNLALWEYKEPVLKSVYLIDKKVFIIESELEQVIMTNLSDSIDFFSIINSAKKVSDNRYETTIEGQKYSVITDNLSVKKIEFLDKLGNRVDIEFSNQNINNDIPNSIFQFKIPQGYDVIKD